jgi:hypothetical protein
LHISFSLVLLSFLVISVPRSLSNLRPSIETNLWEWITRKWNLHRFDALHVVTNQQNWICTDYFLLLTSVSFIRNDVKGIGPLISVYIFIRSHN